MSDRPRQIRWPPGGTLWIRCAQMKPIRALKNTAVSANRIDCWTTIQKVLRPNRNMKLQRPTNSVSTLFSVDR